MSDAPIRSKGYLYEDFRLFHNKDSLGTSPEMHIHDFHKLTMIINGAGTYMIAGNVYEVRSGDIVSVGAGIAHQPAFEAGMLYDRYIFYISREMLGRFKEEAPGLPDIFYNKNAVVIRPSREISDKLFSGAEDIELEQSKSKLSSGLASRLKLMLLIIELQRCMEDTKAGVRKRRGSDDKMLKLLRYINSHISDPISIDDLSKRFYISRYHMMRSFREDFGCTIHEYISNCRLSKARELIRQGTEAVSACYECGFGSYSAFARAYKERYGIPPGRTLKEESAPADFTDYFAE